MIKREDRDLGSLVVRRVGSLVATGDPWKLYRLLDSSGASATAATAYFGELQAAGRSTATQRPYGMALLRWFRFLWAVEISWREATRTEARDFSRWIQITAKPVRPHWRSPDKPPVVKPKAVNPVTGKRPPGRNYAPATVAHCETVLRGFYAYHLEAGTGPLVKTSAAPLLLVQETCSAATWRSCRVDADDQLVAVVPLGMGLAAAGMVWLTNLR